MSKQQIRDLVHNPNLLLDDAKTLEAHITQDMRFNNNDCEELRRLLRLNLTGWIGYRRADGTTKWVRTPCVDGDEVEGAVWVFPGPLEVFFALCLVYMLVVCLLYLFGRN
jgi:hypothetical protein